MRAHDDASRPAAALVGVLAGASAVRLLASIAAGFLALTESADAFPAAQQRAGTVLTAFGTAGDTAGALLLVAAVAIAWWSGGMPRVTLVRVLLLTTAVLVVLRMIGVLLVDSAFGAGSTDAVATGFGLADLMLCLGCLALTGPARAAAPAAGAEPEPVLFAVDRGNGEVFAFRSRAEVARTISLYSVEDEEFDFYDESGRLLEATVVDDRIRLSPADAVRRDELLERLRSFAQKHSLEVADQDAPGAYARPVSDWQWLELWPGWLRWIGRLVRRLSRRPSA